MASTAVNGVNGASHTNGTLTNGDAHLSNGAPSLRPGSYAQKFNIASHFIGGNHLQAASPSSVKNFVANNDGHTVITNVSNISVDLELFG